MRYRVTSTDVARLAGVSQPTVSRALRDLPSITPSTKERVYRAARELGYVPQESGRSLATRTTHRIAIVVDALTNPFYAELVEPIRRELSQHGYRTVLMADKADDVLTADALADGSYDGAIITTATLRSRIARDLDQRHLPLVFANRIAGGTDTRSCTFANGVGAQMIAQLLVESGHQHIALLSGLSHYSTARERESSLITSLRSSSVRVAADDIARIDYTAKAGREAALRLLQRDIPPTALVCGNDVIAIGAMNAARSLGIRVPEDVSIVGFDDIPSSAWDVVSLTTVRCDLTELARESVMMLLGAIAGETVPTQKVLGVSMVLRSSHGPARQWSSEETHQLSRFKT